MRFTLGLVLSAGVLVLLALGCREVDQEYDFDGDGVDNEDDCAPEDPEVYPGNTEICGDGIDNDCSGEADDLDADYDGHLAEACGGDDCDDSTAQVHPERLEACDGLDNDCSGVVDDKDLDLDGHVDEACDGGDDCDDLNPLVHAGAPEVPDSDDNDCDGDVDEGTDLVDDDGDGYSEAEGDCDDMDPDRSPGLDEVCGDGLDNDCSYVADDLDADGDGVIAEACDGPDCDDDDADVHPGAVEQADGVDNNCDGTIDEGTDLHDDDGDGHAEVDGDCDDADAGVHPGATEQPDGVDNNCDGTIDEGTVLYDDDGDGHAEVDGDCNDADAGVHPGAVEICDNGVDEDCTYVADDLDADGDGFWHVDCGGPDCDDGDDQIHPGADDPHGDGVDADCDGADGIDLDGDGYLANPDLKKDPLYDCNDANPLVYPGAPDTVGNGRDDDCDGVDGVDADGDGYAGTDSGGDDCDDTDPAISPGANEIPGNGIDENCDGSDGTGCIDADQDGECAQTDCDDSDPDLNHNDADKDGFVTCPGLPDCDDTDPAVYPLAPDVCDGVLDNDCDGQTDPMEDDADGDGLTECEGDCDDADPGMNLDDVDQDGWTTCAGDCDDGQDLANPGAAEVCDDLIENDCDGAMDCTDGDCAGGPHCPPSGYVTLPAGVFDMGSPKDEVGRSPWEYLHEVTLTRSFEIGVTEVTQAQFSSVMNWDPAALDCWGCGPDHPVYSVSWFDSAAYANEVSLDAGLPPCYDFSQVTCEDKTAVGSVYMDCMNDTQGGIDAANVQFVGPATTPYECEGYRLPTEAEWEYAARSTGVVTDAFPAGGNLISGWEDYCGGGVVLDDGTVLDDQIWYCGNNAHYETWPVGSKPANPVGLFDMAGNLAEWTTNWAVMYCCDETDPWGPATGVNKEVRGGTYLTYGYLCRNATQFSQGPYHSGIDIGFRLARTIP